MTAITGVLGVFLAIQASRVQFVFDDEALEVRGWLAEWMQKLNYIAEKGRGILTFYELCSTAETEQLLE